MVGFFSCAVAEFGLPSRVRSDHGYENASVALVMNLLRGLQHHAHITGRSVHNQRIERLWRDVHKEVTEVIYRELYSLEDEGVLNPDTALHKSILQTVYVPVLQSRLDRFRDAWNSHRLRSENNRSPTQIWRDGMLASQGSGHTATDEVFGGPTGDLHQRVVAELRELVGEQAGAAAANVTAVTSQRCGLSDVQHMQLLRIVERRDMSPSDQCREAISLLQ